MSIARARLPTTILLGALLLCCLTLPLSGCTTSGSTPPLATPTPTEDVSMPQPVQLPTISCDKAVQMIQQKQVSIVRFWYTHEGAFTGISIVQTRQTPISGAAPGVDDIRVLSYHHDPTPECLAQIQAAIKAVNGTLPESQQVKSVRVTAYG